MASKSFSLKIDSFKTKATESLHTITRKIVLGVYSSIVSYNPVGTPETTGIPGYLGGHSRRNWQIGLNHTPTNVIHERDPSGQKTIAEAQKEVANHKAGNIHVIANNVKYIKALEKGHSKQAPNGMVVRTILDYQKIARDAAR